jgi:hypothetical protein
MQYRFTRTPHNQPRIIEGISITQAGRIGLSKHFITAHDIKRGTRVYMYWDANTKAIALAFTRKVDATAYPVLFTQQYGAFITASRFFRSHHLDPTKYARRYPYLELNGDAIGLVEAGARVFVIELSKTADLPA